MKVQALVERALKEIPITRSSDRHLIVAVWHYQNPQWRLDPAKWVLKGAMMPESITRHRRKFQEEGLYPASEKVEGRRYKKYQKVTGEGLDAL